MGAIDYGTQEIQWQYRDPLTSTEFDKRLKSLEPVGIYTGGLLTKVDNTHVSISPLECAITDGTYQVRMVTTSAFSFVVASATPYVVMRWVYNTVNAWYVDFYAVNSAGIQANDIVIGKCIFVVATLTGFSYTERTITMHFGQFLQPRPLVTPVMKVHVSGGWATYGTSRILVPEQDSPVFTAPSTSPKIDLLYIDEATGALAIDPGTEDASPVANDYDGRIVIAEVYLTVGMTQIEAADITDARPYLSASGSLSGICRKYTTSITTADGITPTITHNLGVKAVMVFYVETDAPYDKGQIDFDWSTATTTACDLNMWDPINADITVLG